MKNKQSILTMFVLAGCVLMAGLAMATNLFSNVLILMMDRVNFIPAESSIFTFAPYEINQGSSSYWIYGEDGNNYYYFSYTSPDPYIFISTSNNCPTFNRQDYTTWCTAKRSAP